MNEVARRTLAEIIARHVRPPELDVRRCEGLLRDLCGEHKKEINVLVAALREKVVADLLASGGSVPAAVLLTRCVRRLHDQTGITEDLARWSVESWALALGVIAPDTVNAVEKIAPTTPVHFQSRYGSSYVQNRIGRQESREETLQSRTPEIEDRRLSDLLKSTTTRGWQRIGDHWYWS